MLTRYRKNLYLLFILSTVLLKSFNFAQAKDSDGFSFAVIGDIQYRAPRTDDPRDKWEWPCWYSWLFPQMLDELAAMESPPKFLIIVGDLVEGYPSIMRLSCTNERYDRQYEQLINTLEKHLDPRIAFIPGVGNHEYHRDGTSGEIIHSGPEKFLEHMVSRITIPVEPKNSPYYSFDYEGTHFVMLCTGMLGDKRVDDFHDLVYGEQYKWLVNDITQAAANPEIKHIIAFGHHPFYPLTNNFDAFDNQKFMQERIWKPLFVRYGVKAYIHGHDQFYDRSTHEGVAMIDVGGGSDLENPGYAELRVNHYALFKVKPDSIDVNIQALRPGQPSKLYESYDLQDLRSGKLKPPYEALKKPYQQLLASLSPSAVPIAPSESDGKTLMLHHFGAAPNVLFDSSSYTNFAPLLPGTSLKDGKFGKACWFDGQSGYLEFHMNKMPTSEGLISFWSFFKQFDKRQVILATYRSNTNLKLDTIVGDNKRYLRFGLYDPEDKKWYRVQADAETIAVGQWCYVKLTWDSKAEDMRIFIDGKLAAKETLGFTPNFKKSTRLWIGADSDFSNPFEGGIDELLIRRDN